MILIRFTRWIRLIKIKTINPYLPPPDPSKGGGVRYP